MLVDTHCHIHDARFDEDRADTIERARKAGTNVMVTVGCDLSTARHAMALAQVHPDIFFTCGYHPHEAKYANSETLNKIKQLAAHPKCVAIGECGLDFYYDHSPRKEQMIAFEKQINMAVELKKALVVHVRDAYEDCLTLLRSIPKDSIPVIIHCFSGTLDFAKNCLELSFYLSMSGIVTFKKADELVEVIAHAPIQNLLIETDSPYLSPLPFRGKRNEPAHVTKVAEKIAQIKALSLEEASKLLLENTQRVFGLSLSN